VGNSPINYADPSGHGQCKTQEDCKDMGTTPFEQYEGSGGGDSGNHCNNDPDCELGPGHDEGGIGPICYLGELACQIAADGYEDGNDDFLWKISPDYWIFSAIIPFCPLGIPVCGPAFSVTKDKYGNWYVAGGFGIGLPTTASFGGGWFLGPDNNNEAFAENFLQGHSFTVSGGGGPIPPLGIGPGIGVNNNYPSYIQTNNERMSIDHIAIEGLITTAGVDATGTFGILLYDNGDDTPWIWQGD